MIEVGHISHTGLRREHNEDTYWADTGLGLFLVVDGMGGHGRGEVAAAIARDALVDAARVGCDLESALHAAGKTIAAFAAGSSAAAPVGATLAALLIRGEQFEALRVGDARGYLWHQGSLRGLYADPATEQTEAEAAASPLRRNRATHAIGITAASELGAQPARGRLERGMQFLLCSDGLTEELGHRHVAAVLARTDLAAQECVDHLLLDALDAGGRNNISIVLARAT